MAARSDAAAPAEVGRARDALELSDWRRRVFELYREVRAGADAAEAWRIWRAGRDELFARHPQSPLPEHQRVSFRGLAYFDYDPSARLLATVVPVEPETLDITTSDNNAYRFTRFGNATFELNDENLALELYWLEGYGGGVYLPLRRRDERHDQLRRWQIPARHRQGRRPGHSRGTAGARLQLRIQPLMRLRSALELPARSAGQPARGRNPRRRTHSLKSRHNTGELRPGEAVENPPQRAEPAA